MKIFLSGYMGSGKSVVSQKLSTKLSFPLIDIDDQISLIEELTIPEIFKFKGELYFRKMETMILEDVLEDPNNLIVALGGGTPCYGANLELIKNFPESKMVYLKASVEFLVKRLFKEKAQRPMISHLETEDDLEDFVRKHLFERGYYYNQADLVVNIENRSPNEIVKEIVEKLK
ncbi:shikimate kinase [Gillisia sp. Hel_I_86]|uniref:shikimate kinase n=1 Tax=Gillisia sp. Hel_I_86 TaxID=1249981 RepID=UPI00119A90DA|nr:shikimate kinase [Gillisia sp. Hel_I_86]TVZ27462.1 shikimate kinase [Gillisia sp. Hel_I_86]